MKPSRGRVHKVIAALTPQQAVVQWMADAHQHPSFTACARHLAQQPGFVPPLTVVSDRVDAAIRQALRGQGYDQEYVSRAAQQAVRDALLLMHLHTGVNVRVLDREEQWRLQRLLLTELLQAILDQLVQRSELARARRLLCEQPYPVNAATAAAVRAAQAHAVETWDSLDDAGIILDWVLAAYLEEGRTSLPEGAFDWLLDQDGTRFPWRERPDEAALRSAFPDAATWDAFRERRDFQNGLLDVPDTAVAERVAAVTAALQALVTQGEVQGGQVLALPTVPLWFLQDAPLVDRVWLDREVLALAEWGAELAARGYQLQETDDDHPCAWRAIFPPEGEPDEAQALLAATRTRLERFPGRTQALDQRPFVHVPDYRRWRGRRLKDLPQSTAGMVLASWNAWVGAHGGDGAAEVGGVRVQTIPNWAADLRLTVLPDDEALLQQTDRQTFQAALRAQIVGADEDPSRTFQSLPARARRWRELAIMALCEFYATVDAAATIGQRYFGGAELYFPEERATLTDGLEHVEEMVGSFNRVIAPDAEASQRAFGTGHAAHAALPPLRLDPAAIRAASGRQTALALRFLVDHARSKTLDDVGRTAEGQQIILRHLTGEA